jgi:hypothetical protein
MRKVPITGGLLVRAASTVVYLCGTAAWLVVMAVSAGLRCDDNCLAPEYVDSWRATTDAWQWSAIGWLGLVGLLVALVAVIASWFSVKMGLAAYSLHAAVFVANVVIFLRGADVRVGGGPVLAMLVAAVAGLIAVGLWSSRGPWTARSAAVADG